METNAWDIRAVVTVLVILAMVARCVAPVVMEFNALLMPKILETWESLQ
jgi:hypothetical protein